MIHTSLAVSGVGGYFSQFVFQSTTLPSGISFRKDMVPFTRTWFLSQGRASFHKDVLPFGTDKLHVMDDIHV